MALWGCDLSDLFGWYYCADEMLVIAEVAELRHILHQFGIELLFKNLNSDLPVFKRIL
jgi:hypothetical protein